MSTEDTELRIRHVECDVFDVEEKLGKTTDAMRELQERLLTLEQRVDHHVYTHQDKIVDLEDSVNVLSRVSVATNRDIAGYLLLVFVVICVIAIADHFKLLTVEEELKQLKLLPSFAKLIGMRKQP